MLPEVFCAIPSSTQEVTVDDRLSKVGNEFSRLAGDHSFFPPTIY
jgi:hypothetical protein